MKFVRNRSQFAKWALALVGVALCGIGVVWSGGTSASPARAAVAYGRATAIDARTVPVEWDAYAVGPREASLELIVQHGVCGTLQTAVAEGRDSVVIDIDEEQGPGACPAVVTIGPWDVRLAHPLAGRTIQGPSRQRLPILSPSRLDSVPRLIGFAPQDAAHALSLVSLGEQTKVVHRTSGLRQVVAQYPAPGQRVPKNRVVRITIAER
jgi:hypothetical protein